VLALLALVATVIESSAGAEARVIGHRGAPAELPESTLVGFMRAVDVGAFAVELDVRLTQDDYVVVHHDPFISLDRCLQTHGAPLVDGTDVRALLYDELLRLDCGARTDPAFPRQRPAPESRIPLLMQVAAQIPTARLLIEIKTDDDVDPELTTALVLMAIDSVGATDRVALQSFDMRALEAAAIIAPKIPRIVLENENVDRAFLRARTLDAPAIALSAPLINDDVMRRCQKERRAIMAWTPNTIDEWRRLRSLGVYAIITDDPRGLLELSR
jgi:glycerophosphoryl diester phosphodiesterase